MIALADLVVGVSLILCSPYYVGVLLRGHDFLVLTRYLIVLQVAIESSCFLHMGVKLLRCNSVRLLANYAKLRVNVLFEKSLFELGLFWHRCNRHGNDTSFFDTENLMLLHCPSIALLDIVQELNLTQESLILLDSPT